MMAGSAQRLPGGRSALDERRLAYVRSEGIVYYDPQPVVSKKFNPLSKGAFLGGRPP
jgi:hypothetical protein